MRPTAPLRPKHIHRGQAAPAVAGVQNDDLADPVEQVVPTLTSLGTNAPRGSALLRACPPQHSSGETRNTCPDSAVVILGNGVIQSN